MFPITDSDLKRTSFPFVNIGLIVACAGVFVYELILGGNSREAFFYQFGLIPRELVNNLDFTTLYLGREVIDIDSPIPTWATMFSSMFLHGDWMHFLGNMLFLWVFGDNVEDRLGHFRYLLFYLAAGTAACLLQTITDTGSEIPVIGASGAIAGVLGAYLLLFPYSRIGTVVVLFFFFFVRIPAVYLLGFWIIFQFIPAIGELGSSTQGGGVAYWAHIGGFLFGLAVIMIYKLFRRESLWPRRPGGPRQVKYWRGRPIDY